jgi:hypothetical protein
MSEEDPKAGNIMTNIYMGNEATNCDGSIYGFSNFVHILSEESKKVAPDCTFTELVTKDFSYNLNVDYFFQHRYRTRSIESYFYKELFCASIICLLTIIIYFDYMQKFKSNDIYMYSVLEKNGTVSSYVNMSYVDDSMYDFTKLKARR